MKEVFQKHITRWVAGAGFALGAVLVAQPASAQQQQPQQVDPQTEQTLKELHQTNQHMIQIGQLGQERATNPQVRQYAQTIVKEHQQADKRLLEMGQKHKIDLEAPIAEPPPMQEGEQPQAQPPGQEQPQAVRELTQLRQELEQTERGPEFDRMFVSGVTEAQRNMARELQQVEGQIQVEELRTEIGQQAEQVVKRAQQGEELQRKLAQQQQPPAGQ